jgi:hypothetical protein
MNVTPLSRRRGAGGEVNVYLILKKVTIKHPLTSIPRPLSPQGERGEEASRFGTFNL